MSHPPRQSEAVAGPSAITVGLAYGLAAYLSWGVIPIYFKLLRAVPPLVVLGHRVVWSVGFLALLLAHQGQLRAVARCLADRRALLVLLGSTLMIATNWYTFIWAVSNGHVKEASFGYFVNPLVNVLLGVVVLRERLRPAQVAAIGMAVVGVGIMTAQLGKLPAVSLALAVSFGVYGLLRKVVAAGPLVGLSVETLLLFPVALGYLLVAGPAAAAATGTAGGDRATGGAAWLSALTTWGPGTAGLLVLSGMVTAVPLLWFAGAARRLRLTTIGFLQYVAPTCQLLLAVLAYGEAFGPGDLAAFGCIWAAIGVFSADALRAARPGPAPQPAARTN